MLANIDPTISAGEFVYLIGRVGSGKSSLLKTLYAEMQLVTGEGHVAGFDLRQLRRRDIPYLRRRIGIVFQDYQLLTDRNVFMNLYYVLKATGWKREEEIRRRIEEVLEVVELQHKTHKMPFELSGGEQQRLVIARAPCSTAPLAAAGRRAHGQPRPRDGRRHHASVPRNRAAGLRRGHVHAQHHAHRIVPPPAPLLFAKGRIRELNPSRSSWPDCSGTTGKCAHGACEASRSTRPRSRAAHTAQSVRIGAENLLSLRK